jgi:plastocyanin
MVRVIARMRNITRIGVTATVAATLTLLLIVGGRQGRGEAIAPDSKGPKSIAIDGTRFQPATLVVSVNDAVEWVNHDPFPHNVTSAAGNFRSGNLTPNDRFRFRPAKRGTFEYVCTLHPGMKAVLRVQ